MSCGRTEIQAAPGDPPTPASVPRAATKLPSGCDVALDQVGGAEEGRDKAVGGLVVELDRRADLLDAALVEHRDAVGDRVRLFLVVGDVDRGEAELALQLRAAPRASRPAAWRRGWTAARRAAAPRARSPGCARARRAAAGRRTAAPAGGRRTPSSPTSSSASLTRARDLGARHAAALEPEGDVLGDRHVRPQRVALEHHADVAAPRRQRRHVAVADQDAARARRAEAGDQPQQRGLAASPTDRGMRRTRRAATSRLTSSSTGVAP